MFIECKTHTHISTHTPTPSSLPPSLFGNPSEPLWQPFRASLATPPSLFYYISKASNNKAGQPMVRPIAVRLNHYKNKCEIIRRSYRT